MILSSKPYNLLLGPSVELVWIVFKYVGKPKREFPSGDPTVVLKLNPKPCLSKWSPIALPAAWPIVDKGVYIPWFKGGTKLRKRLPIAVPSPPGITTASSFATTYPTWELTLVKDKIFCFAVNNVPIKLTGLRPLLKHQSLTDRQRLLCLFLFLFQDKINLIFF